MTAYDDWIQLTKTKALLIKLNFEMNGCTDCLSALLDHLDCLWLDAGREITTEMQKYQDVWIEGHLEREAANINAEPGVSTSKKHSQLH